eukprot:EG_transcript_5261
MSTFQPLGRRTGGGWAVYALEQEQKELMAAEQELARKRPNRSRQSRSRGSTSAASQWRSRPITRNAPWTPQPETAPPRPPTEGSRPAVSMPPLGQPGQLARLTSPGTAFPSPSSGFPSPLGAESQGQSSLRRMASRRFLTSRTPGIPTINFRATDAFQNLEDMSPTRRRTHLMAVLRDDVADLKFLHAKPDRKFQSRVKSTLTQQFQGRMSQLSEESRQRLRRLGLEVPDFNSKARGTLRVQDIVLEDFLYPTLDVEPERFLRQAWEELRIPAARKAALEPQALASGGQDVVVSAFWFTFLAFFQPDMLASLTEIIPGLPRAMLRELLSQMAHASQREVSGHFLVDHFHYLVSQAVVRAFLAKFPGSQALFTENWTARVFALVELMLTGTQIAMETLLDTRARLLPNPIETDGAPTPTLATSFSPRGGARRMYRRAEAGVVIQLTKEATKSGASSPLEALREGRRDRKRSTVVSQGSQETADDDPELSRPPSPRLDPFAIEMCLELDRTLTELLSPRRSPKHTLHKVPSMRIPIPGSTLEDRGEATAPLSSRGRPDFLPALRTPRNSLPQPQVQPPTPSQPQQQSRSVKLNLSGLLQ